MKLRGLHDDQHATTPLIPKSLHSASLATRVADNRPTQPAKEEIPTEISRLETPTVGGFLVGVVRGCSLHSLHSLHAAHGDMVTEWVAKQKSFPFSLHSSS